MPGIQLIGDLMKVSSKIEEEYGIKVDNIIACDKGYIVSDGEKLLNVKKVDEGETCLINMGGLYDYIKGRGFNNTLSMYVSKWGKYYMSCGSSVYMVFDYVEDSSVSFREDVESIIRLLAKFHKSACGYIPPTGGKAKSYWGRWTEEYRKELRCIKKYRDGLKSKNNKTPFEELFLKTCGEYINRMEKSVNILKVKGYLSYVEESMKERQVCVGSFKQSNFYKIKQDVYLKSLNKCVYDIWEKDIAELLRKVVEYNADRGVGKLRGLIDIYNSENNVLESSVNIIKAFLLFPYEFEKVCSRYYRGKDKWTEDEYISKLKNAMLAEDKKAELEEVLS